MKKAKKEKRQVRPPGWFSEDLLIPFEAGISHTFLIHGDINAMVQNLWEEEEAEGKYIPLKKFLERALDSRPMVMFYNIASGIQFLDPDMEKEFRRVSGLEEGSGRSSDPVAAAKADLSAKRPIPRDPDSCLPLIEKALKEIEGAALVVQSIHFLAPATAGSVTLPPNERATIERFRNWSQDEGLGENGVIILLTTDQAAKVSSELRSSGEIQTVFINKPDKDERVAFVEYLAKSFRLPKGLDLDVFGNATQGLGLRQIFEIFLHSKKTGKPVDLEYVKAKKFEILNAEYADVMEIVDPLKGLEDIGGLEYVKVYFLDVVDAIKKGDKRRIPMGILLVGPPGTGKTAIVEALAREAGFNFVKVKNVKGPYVGESEQRKEKQLNGLRALAPVIVMNDEADLADVDRDSPKGDSGVSDAIMKMWMEFLSDPKIRGQVIVISCSNRPDNIDPAIKRSGRSDERILLPMPSAVERKAIFEVGFRYHKIPTCLADFGDFADMTENFSGGDIIEKIIPTSFRFASAKGEEEVDAETLRAAIDDTILNASQAQIDLMTLLGLRECSSRTLLPPNIKEIVLGIKSRNLVENLDNILADIKNRRIVDIDEPQPF